MVNVFVTGASGFIGGDLLFAITRAHPDWKITALVRNSTKTSALQNAIPNITLVEGSLDDTALIADHASKTDIVLHTANADHEPAAAALMEGLAKGHTAEEPGYLIHTSASGILAFADLTEGTFGTLREKEWDDMTGLEDVKNIPSSALHKDLEAMILDGRAKYGPSLHTALVCPPTIHGVGRGTGNTRSIQIPFMSEAVLKRGKGFRVGEGTNMWNSVHIEDLSALFLMLADAAVNSGGKASWDNQGYYFAGSESYAWKDGSKWIADAAKNGGWIKTAEVDALTVPQALEVHPWAPLLWGSNSRSVATRAKEVLGWKPQGESMREAIPEMVAAEAKRLGM